MKTISGLKLLRTVTQRTLADIGKELCYKRAHLSHIERDPGDAGPKLKKKLERLYDADWAFLSSEFDGAAIAASLVQHYGGGSNV